MPSTNDVAVRRSDSRTSCDTLLGVVFSRSHDVEMARRLTSSTSNCDRRSCRTFQNAGQYPSVYNLTSHQNVHQSPTPMIPVPQQLTISPSERNAMYDPSLLQTGSQHTTPMNTRRGRASVDAQYNMTSSPVVSQASPEKRTRSRTKKASVDSQSNDLQEQPAAPQQQPAQQQEELHYEQEHYDEQSAQLGQEQPLISMLMPCVEDHRPSQIIDGTIAQQTMNDEEITSNASTNDGQIEVNPFVSKSNHEEDQKDIEKEREERGDSRSPSVGSSSAKSESVIKEIPLSGERHRLSRSKSPKSRWHHSPSPQDQEQQQQQQQQQQLHEEEKSQSTTVDDDNRSASAIAHDNQS
jgi:hypothetical protein